MSALRNFRLRVTPQDEPIFGSNQVQNSAGGYSYQVDPLDQFLRFLILGTEGGSYYVSERKLTRENAENILNLLQEGKGSNMLNLLLQVVEENRAPRNDQCLFALALILSKGNVMERHRAAHILPRVARTASHLFQFISYLKQFRGWGRLARKAVANWYDSKDERQLAYQVLKYRQREGWTHRDVLRVTHPTKHPDIYNWITKDEFPIHIFSPLRKYLEEGKLIQSIESVDQACELIGEHKFTWDMVNTNLLSEPRIWHTLLPEMPITALVRNLGRMASIGMLRWTSDSDTRLVIDKLTNTEAIQRSRIHPLTILQGMIVYKNGHGRLGSNRWTPNVGIIDALNEAYYMAFGNVEPAGKKTLLALDVSSSMQWGRIAGIPGFTPHRGAAAMATVTLRTEPDVMVTAFQTNLTELFWSRMISVEAAMESTRHMNFGGTDCALPMIWAMKNNIRDIETFIIYTDSETWAGRIHPSQALQKYRDFTGIPARLVVVGMVSNGFTIADPADPGMLDVVGFDTATPNIINQFSRGDI